MKQLLFTILMMMSISAFGQNITVLQINAEWNDNNTREDLKNLKGCTYQFGYLEEQSASMKNGLSSVPTVILFKDGKVVKVYKAGVMLTLDTPFDEIQSDINAIKED